MRMTRNGPCGRPSLTIRDVVAELNQPSARSTLEVQLGVATGEALVAADATSDAGEAAITGGLIAKAVRLQQAAHPGRCWLTRPPGGYRAGG